MFMPVIAAAAACRGSASGKMMIGFLPPSSRVTSFSPSAASRAMTRPVGTEPTNPMRLMSGWRTRADPVVPSPVSTLTTPGGNRPSHSSPSLRLDSGACSEPLTTTQLPAARGAAAFSAQKRKGWLNGLIFATTPQGCRRVKFSWRGPRDEVSPLISVISPAK